MANHVSAVKRENQAKRRTAFNRQRKGILRASLRGFRETLADGKIEAARPELFLTSSSIDKAAKKGIIHKNAAARLKSRLTVRMNALASAKA